MLTFRRDPHVSNVIRIESGVSGPRAVIFSGIHGDEVSGIHAVEKLFFDFNVGYLNLERGSLTLVRGNQQAIAAERRYIKYNLNRMFKNSYDASVDQAAYEFRRAQELKKLIEDCDYF